MIGIGTNLQDNIDNFLIKNGVKLYTDEYALSNYQDDDIYFVSSEFLLSMEILASIKSFIFMSQLCIVGQR